MGFIIHIDNFKKNSLCELKLKTEKFENIHTKKKKEKIRKKRKEKEKQIHAGAKEQKRKKENIRKKKRILTHVILKSITGNKQ